MAQKLGRAWLRDSRQSCLLSLVFTAVALPLAFCLMVLPGWVTTSGLPMSDLTVLLVVVTPALLLLLLVGGGGFGVVAYSLRSRARWLDDVLAPLDLEGSAYTLGGRQYRGVYRGRSLAVLYYRGPTFSLRVGTAVATRVAVAASSDVIPGLSKLFGGVPMPLEEPSLEGLTVFAHDETWGRHFVSDSQVTPILRRLVEEPSGFLFQQVHLAPDVIYLHFYRQGESGSIQLGPEKVQAWADDLVRLAEMAEKLPAPEERLEMSRLERYARSGGFSPKRPLLLIVLFFLSGLLCSLLGFAGVLLYFSG